MTRTTIRAALLAALLAAAAGTVAASATARATAAPRNTTEPRITGTKRVGETLRTSNGRWSGSPKSFDYRWYRCNQPGKTACVVIAGAAARTYRLVQADVGHNISVVVTACNADGCTPAGSSAVGPIQGNAPPANTAAPTVSGRVAVGGTLTATTGSWTNGPTRFAYQWLRCDSAGNACGAIGGATARTYAATADDAGSTLRVRVTAHNARGDGVATSGPTAPVATGTGGSAVPVSTISLPDRLNVAAVEFSPRVLRSRAPFVARFRIADTKGRAVQGALVYAIGLPYGWVRSAPETASDANGWATITFSPTRLLPRRASIVFFVRARKPGEPLLGGVSTRRLVQVTVRF